MRYPTLLLSFCLLLTPALVLSDEAESPDAPRGVTAEQPALKEEVRQESANAVVHTGEALTVKTRLVDLFEVSKGVNLSNKALREKARTQVEAALDWNRIAADCLGKRHWAKQSEKGRNDFRNMLKEVVILTAYSRLDKFWKGASYQFEKFESVKGTMRAPTKFIIGNSSFMLEYFLEQKEGKWWIIDIAYEGVRYSENISAQIDGFLREKPFTELLGKLKKRREELVADAKKPAKAR